MAGLVPAIHVSEIKKDVDARHKAGHDDFDCCGYRDTCAETASHFPFSLAQQSV